MADDLRKQKILYRWTYILLINLSMLQNLIEISADFHINFTEFHL